MVSNSTALELNFLVMKFL